MTQYNLQEPPAVATEADASASGVSTPTIPVEASTAGHILVLDAWRGTAVALLLAGHFAAIPKINCGRLGVEFFFVLSGFLMGRILFLKRTPLDLFYKRRISRIVPAAYAFLMILVVLSCTAIPAWKSSVLGVAVSYLFLTNYYAVGGWASYGDLKMPVEHFWSLSVEEHTYVFLSLIAICHRHSRVPAVAMLLVAFLACQASAVYFGLESGWNYYSVYWRSDCRAASIIIGAVAACLAGRVGAVRTHYAGMRGDLLGVAMVLLGATLNLDRIPELVKYSAGTVCLASGLFLVARHVRTEGLLFRPLIWLGTASYSIYIWQQPFYELKRVGLLSAPMAVALALAVGVASYLLIERPTRQYLNARWAKS